MEEEVKHSLAREVVDVQARGSDAGVAPGEESDLSLRRFETAPIDVCDPDSVTVIGDEATPAPGVAAAEKEIGETNPQELPFTHGDFKRFSSKIDYLYTQTVAKEGLRHKETLENARAAMQMYEECTRKNFIARDKDVILDCEFMTTPKIRDEVTKLASPLFQYFRALFGDEWQHGRPKVDIRCEPCYEAYRSARGRATPALAKEERIP
ncbi:hypothetical protein Y032_0039g152 [Ancylostoma ceylanicum]|uniref:Uncharacterized protein n=1 Tax=Ancylostoma ceylanicum TaxID=53326 RepID=A0A016UIV8_9BILA|nr:hypothetical protein Y032_0039g152 [Ancylostoma ceylanicum]